MAEVTIEDKLYSSILSYCSLNGISDVDDFISDVLLKGFMIVKNGYSPKDKISIEKENDSDVINSSSLNPYDTKVMALETPTTNNNRKVKITIKKKAKDD